MKIRYATYLDQFEICSFIEKCINENNLPFDRQTIDNDLDNFSENYLKDNMLVLVENGKIFGTAAYKVIDDNTLKIVRVYLHSDLKGRGLGKVLVYTLISIIKIKHKIVNVLYLTTNTESMKAAVNLYEKLGFEKCDDFEIKNKRVNVLMKKLL